MKGYIDNIGLEIAIAIVTVLTSLLTWGITRISMYKKSIRDKVIDEIKTDTMQDKAAIRLEGRVNLIDKMVEKMQHQIEGMKQDSAIVEQKLYNNFTRVEDKIDKLYTLILEDRGHGEKQ
jgi:hypothetical protein